jgi:hypothetical protein
MSSVGVVDTSMVVLAGQDDVNYAKLSMQAVRSVVYKIVYEVWGWGLGLTRTWVMTAPPVPVIKMFWPSVTLVGQGATVLLLDPIKTDPTSPLIVIGMV